MTTINPYIKTALKYGLLGGALIILLFLVLHFLNMNPIVLSKKLDYGFIIIPLIVFFSVKEFREYKNGGELKFGQGMTVGFFTYVFLALISSLFIFILFSAEPKFLDEYILDRTSVMESKKTEIIETLSHEAYAKTYADLQNTTPFILAIDDLLKKIFTGLFVTIIISVLLRR